MERETLKTRAQQKQEAKEREESTRKEPKQKPAEVKEDADKS